MANIFFHVSGSWLISSTNPTLDRITRSISGTATASTFAQLEVVVLPTQSDVIVSLAQLSAPLGVFMTATNLVRVNFGGMPSSFSAASAGIIQFKEYFGYLGVSAGGGYAVPSSVHIANSGTDSSTVTVLLLG